jgi:hypothetical protein
VSHALARDVATAMFPCPFGRIGGDGARTREVIRQFLLHWWAFAPPCTTRCWLRARSFRGGPALPALCNGRRGDAGLRRGRHWFWLRRRRRGIPLGAHGASLGGPRAGAALAAWRLSDDDQGPTQSNTVNGPCAEAGRSCQPLLPVGGQGAHRVRRIRPGRWVADQRWYRPSARPQQTT